MNELRNRPIRRFVMRAGRQTVAQTRALEDLWPRLGVEYSPQPLSLDELFGRHAPRTLEIGFGNGEHLAALAAANPGRDYLGIEVHRPGVGHLLLLAETQKLTNVRAAGKDEAVTLTPPIQITLESAIEFIEDDELVEVTPKSIRLRKRFLSEHDRKRAARDEKAA